MITTFEFNKTEKLFQKFNYEMISKNVDLCVFQ